MDLAKVGTEVGELDITLAVGFPMSAKLCRHTGGSVENGTGWCWRVAGDVRGACGGDSVKRRVDGPRVGTSP